MPRKGRATLLEERPDLAEQWHKSKNGGLSPAAVSVRSGKKVWWQCDVAEDHEWMATPDKRVSGRGCPACAGKLVVKSNCLSTVNQELSLDWHPTLNGSLKPHDVTSNSNKKVWWKCSEGDDHEWQASVGDRSQGKGCPFCAGRKVSKTNCFATTRPEKLILWHPEKNGDLKPTEITGFSGKRVWWKCEAGHEWQISPRNLGGCAKCLNQKVSDTNNLSYRFPEIALEWHPSKNGELRPELCIAGSNKKVWWQCGVHSSHAYQATIASRTGRKSGCPFCSGKKVNHTNSLRQTDPLLVREWHPTKNPNLTPDEVTRGSDKKVWWICPKGLDHEWVDSISHRTINNRGCAVCAGNVVVKSNCLATTHPELASEWHPTLNLGLTSLDVTAGSHKKIWWRCKNDDTHEWKAVLYSRTTSDKVGCPYCDLTPQSKQELTITFELKAIWPSIDPKGFKVNVDGKLWTIDIFIEHLNLGIEFDGSFWHKDKRKLDKMKTRTLKNEGFDVLRIREMPLRKISSSDIISEKPFDAKRVTDEVLEYVLESYALMDAEKERIHSYRLQPALLGEKARDSYIEKRLASKREKRRGKMGKSE